MGPAVSYRLKMMTRLSLRTLTASTPLTLLTVAALTALFATVAVKGFELTVFGALALYFVLWWTFLFAILPLGNAAEADPQRLVPGQDPGAPASPRLREKALLTTLLAAIAFFAALLIFPLARL
ncbi:UNVERIFIED_ORG: putative secreted protein [Methylobacterium sp. SuP10 SLI 274]|nr:putative secreted protein [Methylorubrum extorquens]MDF9861680.1 putative secreted protein [Methylorubrum pseudosasae]MDH6635307.1 putative secreted protein [Methylobacterium sp. SuP10 SLI 274]MDH6664478.1 putative secreted protein [Methylorubrum zatmanii]